MRSVREYCYRVRVNRDRPDFRTVIAFLYGDFHEVDTEGNSSNPASREWTALYIKDRKSDDPSVDIGAVSTDPLLLEVSSKDEMMALRVAMFLYDRCGTAVFSVEKEVDIEKAWAAIDSDWNLKAAMARAKHSIWNRSTLDNPYPHHSGATEGE